MSVSGSPGSQGPATLTPAPHHEQVPTQSMVSGESGAPAAASPITVIWASAIPVRLAVAKMHAGQNPVPDEAIAHAEQVHDSYVIAVVGLPAAPGRGTLSARGKAAMAKGPPDYRRIGSADVYFYRFAKPPFEAHDGKAEFRFQFGSTTLKTNFDLGTMTYDGKLAL